MKDLSAEKEKWVSLLKSTEIDMSDLNEKSKHAGVKQMILDAMEYHWNDFIGDTHTLPNDINLSNPKTKASFSPGEWAERVANDVASKLTGVCDEK